MQQDTIEQRIHEIFSQYPDLRVLKNKKRLVWYYWTLYDKLGKEMQFETFTQLTDEESITRARRQVLSNQRYMQIESLVESQKYREYYANK
jgi:hypothetical protein